MHANRGNDALRFCRICGAWFAHRGGADLGDGAKGAEPDAAAARADSGEAVCGAAGAAGAAAASVHRGHDLEMGEELDQRAARYDPQQHMLLHASPLSRMLSWRMLSWT